jgi:hypothetical protein
MGVPLEAVRRCHPAAMMMARLEVWWYRFAQPPATGEQASGLAAYAHLPHTYDLSTPSFATDVEIVGHCLEEYDVGADIGYDQIDVYHDLPYESPEQNHPIPPRDHPENVWLKDGKRTKLQGPFTVLCKHEDGVNLALHYGTEDESEILTGKSPRSWRARDGIQSIEGRYGIVINRKVYRSDMPGTGRWIGGTYPHSEENCHFVVAHEPYKAEAGYKIQSVWRLRLEERQCTLWDPNGYEISKELHGWTTPRVIEVRSEGFTDYFVYVDHPAVLRGGEPGRVKMETPFFNIDFSGAYAWLRRVNGEIAARQGTIDSLKGK